MINPDLSAEELKKVIELQKREILEVKQSVVNELNEARLDWMTNKKENTYHRIVQLINELSEDIKEKLNTTTANENV